MRSGLLDLLPVRTRLFAALGLSPIALAGCGGIVVLVDDEGGGGEGGGSTASVTSVTSGTVTSTSVSSSTGFICDVPDVVYACNDAAPGLCPPAGTPQAVQLMNEVLAQSEECEDWCYCETYVTSVPCGPDPIAVEGCCYYATIVTEMGCMGRPFEIEGQARTADLLPRSDWVAAVPVEARGLDAEARRALADGYRRDAQYEHASVASFARFALELLALGAPARLVRQAQQAMADEIRHAELCFGVASALDGQSAGPGPLPVVGALADRGDPVSIIEAVIHEGCVGETLSALVALAARDAATDENVRMALDEIARDELAHAELAWATVAWARAQASEEVVAAIDDVLDRISPTLADDADPDLPGGIMRAYGRLPRRDRLAVVRQGFDQVVRPLAQAVRSGQAALPTASSLPSSAPR